MKEKLTDLIMQFYQVPAIDAVVQNNAMLRIAVKSYGVPLFLITVALIFLMLILLAMLLKPKKGRPKKIREPKTKKAVTKKRQKAQKPLGAPKAILRKLAKLPPSTLPLYPVADKHRGLTPALDDDHLVDSLINDAPVMPEPAMAVAPAAPAQAPKATPVQSFSIADLAAMAPAATPATSDNDRGPEQTTELDIAMPDFDITPPAFGNDGPASFGRLDDGDEIGDEASEDDGDLSDEARRKFEELRDRGVTS